ncbi:long-chain-fatty-acid--CoA ligase [Gordoniibacillus kamchatkensis]|uniref:long-chain-fatty-acid--CoA ligase n=1 Tax=Gordoniibacillus kamchatkensis TaxID=1590651 RepID=UPI000697463E|nr:long-chain fatty acid--CoA ligase [Paenibacillus sp. VKM B-2647]
MATAKPWLRHYPEEVAPTGNYPEMNVASMLLASARRYPKRPALYFMGKTMSYARTAQEAAQFAAVLRSLGVRKGDRVALMLPNCPQMVIACFGALMAGAVVVMTNPLYMERELEHQLADSGAKAIVTLDLLHNRIAGVMRRTKLEYVIVTSLKDYLPFPKNFLYPIKMKKDGVSLGVSFNSEVLSWRRLMATPSAVHELEPVDPHEDLALLQYTGGTTGISKGVMLTHANLIANTIQNVTWAYKCVDGEERFLAALPFFHVFGLSVVMLQAVYRAAEMLLLPRFETKPVLELIARKRPTLFPGAPTMYVALLNYPDIGKYDLSSIRACISGSAPLPREVQLKFEDVTGGRLIEGYGLTEASPVTHANNIWEKRKAGIGIPLPDTDARIVDPETGEELPAGEIGELAVSGPQVMKGYWNRPDETAKVLRDGWLHTGDMARMDEDGFFEIVDRKKDMIIASGYNIYPREIEEVLFEHPAVKEAAVAGVPDQYRGETVKAFVVVKDGASVTAAELETFCRERLAAYKVPRKFEFRAALPKTLVGKVLRRQLLEEELLRGASAAGEAKGDSNKQGDK